MKTWLWPRKNGNEGLRLKATQQEFPTTYTYTQPTTLRNSTTMNR